MKSPRKESAQQRLNRRLVEKLTLLRKEKGLTLDDLAEKSGISRATLSRFERGGTDPTAAMLGTLCALYGSTLSRLMTDAEGTAPQLVRAEDQPIWKDPATGFVRRALSPPVHGLRGELLEGRMPPGARIDYAHPPIKGQEQHLWMLGGALELGIDGEVFQVKAGDCLRYRIQGATYFHNLGRAEAHYVIAIIQP